MRFWRRPGPEPVAGPDPGADAVTEETENHEPAEQAPVAPPQPPPPSPEPDAEQGAVTEPVAEGAERTERGLWSGGFWRRPAPVPQPETAEPPTRPEPAPVDPVRAEVASLAAPAPLIAGMTEPL